MAACFSTLNPPEASDQSEDCEELTTNFGRGRPRIGFLESEELGSR